ncbi:hypothetical protein K1719_011126 [Acacia pycnantha]|nr:hypothetical protein K1719_011126 [Acacia pycnantha]
MKLLYLSRIPKGVTSGSSRSAVASNRQEAKMRVRDVRKVCFAGMNHPLKTPLVRATSEMASGRVWGWEARWEGKAVNDSYEWMEKVVAFHPVMSPWQSAVRDGLLQSGVVPYNGFAYNHINGTKVGGTIFDPDGHRHTAADLLRYANPSQITVLLHATVHKIFFPNPSKGKSKATVARGVIFRDSRGAKHKAYLKNGPKNEIIVSAGALGSPQLLMLSGIGPKAYLKAHNITMVLDQPFVGKGMSDNP